MPVNKYQTRLTREKMRNWRNIRQWLLVNTPLPSLATDAAIEMVDDQITDSPRGSGRINLPEMIEFRSDGSVRMTFEDDGATFDLEGREIWDSAL